MLWIKPFQALFLTLLSLLLLACARQPATYEKVVAPAKTTVVADAGEALARAGLAKADLGFILMDGRNGVRHILQQIGPHTRAPTFNSRSVASSDSKGATKNWAKRSKAGCRCSWRT